MSVDPDRPASLAKNSETTVLRVRNYSLSYNTESGHVDALKSIDLDIKSGQTLGLVGESGSGKTSLAWAIMRYLPRNAVERSGLIKLLDEDLRQKSAQEIMEIRGRRISMVFQDPNTSLNPVLPLGNQIAEVLIRHRGLSQSEALEEGEALLARTGISRPSEMMRRYSHEASGGEKQRVVIATAFACNPELIVFDEPTTALDIITARQILDLFESLREETNVTALYISHDLGLVSRIATEVSVINEGEIVENGPCSSVFRKPRHRYTKDLLAAVPRPTDRIVAEEPDEARADLLDVENITVNYASSAPGILSFLSPGKDDAFGAESISFKVRTGEILGLVGESGSGKSTMAKVLAGLQDFEGMLSFNDKEFTSRRKIERRYRRDAQIVFQHPDASLNPRQTIGSIMARPLKLYGLARKSELKERVAALLEDVKLPPEFADRYPFQLSGGEKQRVAIARAFAAEPKLVICDEITSSLDVSVQASVARLLVSLQQRTGTACIFITHDLNLVRQLAHRIAVMQNGKMVDLFMTEDATSDERHQYTRALLSAVPVPGRSDGETQP